MKKVFHILKRLFRKEIPVTDFDEKIVHDLVVHPNEWMINRVVRDEVEVFRAKHRGISIEVGVAGIPERGDYSATIAQQGGVYPAAINETLAENLWWALHTCHEAQQQQFRKEWADKVTAQLDDLDSTKVSDNTE